MTGTSVASDVRRFFLTTPNSCMCRSEVSFVVRYQTCNQETRVLCRPRSRPLFVRAPYMTLIPPSGTGPRDRYTRPFPEPPLPTTYSSRIPVESVSGSSELTLRLGLRYRGLSLDPRDFATQTLRKGND